MISLILTIRFKQLGRIVNNLGLGRFIFIVIIIAMITLFIFMSIRSRDGVYFSTGIWLLLILTLHLKRKDLSFLLTHIEKYRFLLVIEYIVISIPVIAGLIYWNHYADFALFLGLLIGIAFITRSIRKITLNTWLQQLIPDECFEWKAGIRNSLIYLAPLILLGFACAGWPGTIPIVMILIGLIALGFTEKNEPLPLLLMFEKSSYKFLLFKIGNQLKLYSILVIPLMIVYIIIHYEYWYIVAAFYLLNIVVQTYAILSKYSFYQPHVITGSQAFNIIGSISIVVPLLLPLILVLGIRFYFKSVSNLNQYLYDYN
jgi:hypothetical protein